MSRHRWVEGMTTPLQDLCQRHASCVRIKGGPTNGNQLDCIERLNADGGHTTYGRGLMHAPAFAMREGHGKGRLQPVRRRADATPVTRVFHALESRSAPPIWRQAMLVRCAARSFGCVLRDQCTTSGTKPRGNNATGRARRADRRGVTHARRVPNRFATLRPGPAAARDRLRRTGARIAFRVHSKRVRMFLSLRSSVANTAADRIAVCSLEKRTFPGGRNRVKWAGVGSGSECPEHRSQRGGNILHPSRHEARKRIQRQLQFRISRRGLPRQLLVISLAARR